MRKHTAGEWEVSDQGGNVMRGQDHVAMVNQNLPEWRENARLIAAAPELLNICLGILEVFEHGDRLTSVSKRIAAQNLRRAINKAQELV